MTVIGINIVKMIHTPPSFSQLIYRIIPTNTGIVYSLIDEWHKDRLDFFYPKVMKDTLVTG